MVLCAYSPILACKVLGTSENGPGIKVTLFYFSLKYFTKKATYGEEEPQLMEASNVLGGNEIILLKKGTDYVFDEKNKILSTPLFNFSTNSILEVDNTIKKLVEKYL